MKWLMALVVMAGALVAPAAGPANAVDDIPRKGADISWPNCPKGMGIPSRRTLGLPMPKKHAQFAIIGLTNGPGREGGRAVGAHHRTTQIVRASREERPR